MPGGSVNGRPFRESSDSYQRTGIPCGNPKRFRSHEVVRMEPGQRSRSGCIDGPLEEIETAGQKHLQTLLQKQMESQIPLQQYIHQKKEFSKGAEYNPVSKETSGMVTLDDFKVLEQTDGYIEELKACGLTFEEILYKLQTEDTEPDAKKGKFTNAAHEESRLSEIERKIREKRDGLEKPDTFSNVKTLSRHELDLEKALSGGNQTNAFLHKVLIQERSKDQRTSSSVMSQLPGILDSFTTTEPPSQTLKKKSNRKLKHDKYKIGCTLECCVQDTGKGCYSCDLYECKCDNSKGSLHSTAEPTCSERPDEYVSQYDLEKKDGEKQNKASKKRDKEATKSTAFCVITNDNGASKSEDTGLSNIGNTCSNGEELRTLHDVEGIPDDVIMQYKLSHEQVRQIPRFDSHTPGEPSNVLYVKNLSPKLTEEELAAVFINFQTTKKDKIVFKLLSGRMKGQAFVTFPDIQTATKALQLIHGYQYKGKPVILQFGKKTKT